MSVELFVYLRNDCVPSQLEWQAGIHTAGLKLILDEFSPCDHAGFLPCRLNGGQCGFEYYLGAVADLVKDLESEDIERLRKQIGERDRVVTLRLHGGRMDDLMAAMYAAAVLAELSDGVFEDPQSGEFATGRGVFELLRRNEDSERERGRRAAEKDAAVTDRRCPHCNAPCPSYRKTCKACGHTVGDTK